MDYERRTMTKDAASSSIEEIKTLPLENIGISKPITARMNVMKGKNRTPHSIRKKVS